MSQTYDRPPRKQRDTHYKKNFVTRFLLCTLRFNFLLPELAPVTCDVPSTTIGIAELISVHLSSPCSSRNNTRRRNPCDSFSIAAETPVTCDLSPVSSGPLSLVQSESTLAAPRGGTPACPGVSYSQQATPARGGGGSRTVTGHSTILFLNRGFAGAQAAGALLP